MIFNKKIIDDINKAAVLIDAAVLRHENISVSTAEKYFPKHIIHPKRTSISLVKYIHFSILKFWIETFTKIFLRTPKNRVGDLDVKEVDDIYRREAKTYNNKHHLTTRGMDLIWRRNIGWFIAASNVGRTEPLKILDLCTGTGLTIKEICIIFDQWSLRSEIIGLDYNSEMLNIAGNDVKSTGNCQISFVKGDAMNLVESIPNPQNNVVQFKCNSFDYVIQMFGVGGIDKPVKEFYDVLQVLKPGGEFYIIDMHRPISTISGELPFLFKWLKFPALELFLYDQTTIPLVLNKLWGWRDTTPCFYALNLIAYKDDDNNYWGFEVVVFEQESQRWWLSLPLMPTGKIVVKKIMISEDEFKVRRSILKACKSGVNNLELL